MSDHFEDPELHLRDLHRQSIVDAATRMPANTRAAYLPKIQEFREYCDKKGFMPLESRYTIDALKLNGFLREEIKEKEVKKGRAPNHYFVRLSLALFDQYIDAIVYEHGRQRALGTNNNPSPRDQAVRELRKEFVLSTNERNRANFVDRAQNTPIDGLVTQHSKSGIANHFLGRSNFSGMRDRAAFFLSLACLFRGEDARVLELADLMVMPIADNVINGRDCDIFMFLLTKGKTNRTGRKLFASAIRHQDPFVCPIGSLGLYLFYRYHIRRESFPDMSTSRLWFTKKLFVGERGSEDWSYSGQSRGFREALLSVGILTKKPTHITRSAGAQTAELEGVEESEILRFGRWETRTMSDRYLRKVPINIVRALAGFPVDTGIYFLKRAFVVPSPELTNKIFPDVEHWLERVMTGTAEQTLSAQQFLLVLEKMRTIILQDAAILMEKFPSHPVFQSEIFLSHEFLLFKSQVIEAHINGADLNANEMNRVVPQVASSISVMGIEIAQCMNEIRTLRTDVRNGREEVLREVRNIRGFLNTVASAAASYSGDLSIQNAETAILTEIPTEIITPQYQVNRTIQDVVSLATEWKQGIDGGPSVESLERLHGSKWRKIEKERKYFERRRPIFHALEFMTSEISGLSCLDAARILESYRGERQFSLIRFAELFSGDRNSMISLIFSIVEQHHNRLTSQE